MPNQASAETYSQVKERLDQIFKEVSDQDVSLDDALDLYEEAVKLGMRASELIEEQAAPSQRGELSESAMAEQE